MIHVNILASQRRKENDSVIDNLGYNYGSNNRLQSVNDSVAATTAEDWDAEDTQFQYDANGNVILVTESNGGSQDRVLRIQYDHRNLPVSLHITDDNLDRYVYYRYNADGQRIYKKVGSQNAEHYIMDGEQNAAVFDEDGELRYWNILAAGVVGRLDSSGARFYYIKDHLGSTRAVLNSSGVVVEAHDYYPFGLKMPGKDYQTAERTKELFTGKERDTETNWYWFGPGRYYFPPIGRWLSVDPILSLKLPQDLIHLDVFSEAPYVYTSNNPIVYIDKYGFVKWGVVGKGTLKLTGGLAGAVVSGYALAQTGGGAALFGAVLGFTSGLATMSLGFGEIISGFVDQEFTLSDGLIVATSVELGVDKKTALKLAMAWDLLNVGQSAANVVSKTGTTLNELELLLNSQSLSDDVRAQIQEYVKSQEQMKEKEKKKKEKEKKEKKKKRD